MELNAFVTLFVACFTASVSFILFSLSECISQNDFIVWIKRTFNFYYNGKSTTWKWVGSSHFSYSCSPFFLRSHFFDPYFQLVAFCIWLNICGWWRHVWAKNAFEIENAPRRGIADVLAYRCKFQYKYSHTHIHNIHIFQPIRAITWRLDIQNVLRLVFRRSLIERPHSVRPGMYAFELDTAIIWLNCSPFRTTHIENMCARCQSTCHYIC